MTRVEHDPWLHRFATFVAFCTFILIIAGGLVTSTGSALAVPDWPLSYGMLMPPMVGGIFYEHGHRMIAGPVGLLMIGLAVWLHLREPRAWVRRLGLAALGLIVTQAVLGGITVLLLLPPAVSTAHACLGQAFFCIAVTLALVTSRAWKQARPEPASAVSTGDTASPVVRLGIITTSAVFLQLAIGALMRHTDSGLSIPDFPLSFGHLIPPFESYHVAIAFAHRLGALVVTACIGTTVATVFRRHRRASAILGPAIALLTLLFCQVALGAFTVWSAKAIAITTAHEVTGALILATSLVLTLQSARRVSARGIGREGVVRSKADADPMSPESARKFPEMTS